MVQIGLRESLVNDNPSQTLIGRPEEMLRLVLDTIPQFIFWKDRQSVYIGCNENFAKIAGVGHPDNIIGKTDFDLPWLRGEAEFFREVDQRVMSSGKPEVHIIEPQRQADGQNAWLDTSKVPLHDDDGRVVGILGAFEDITNRMRREREQETLLEVARSLRHAGNRQELVDGVLEKILRLLDADGVSLVVPDSGGGSHVVEAARGLWSDLKGKPVATNGASLTESMLQNRIPYLNNAIAGETKLARREIVKGTPSLAGVPLIADGDAFGVFWIGRKRSIHRDDVALLSAIADITASAMRRITLHERLNESHQELRVAYESTLEGWARALELRDGDTIGHTRRAAELTVKLAKQLGLPSSMMDDILRGALLHDIGKMAVPDAILRKPGPLNEEEWQVMRLHPVYSQEILEPIEFLRNAREIPYSHHERWDGSGYPEGLSAEAIPLVARVFAVVDVWDALRSDRPYRKAWSLERSIAYFEENSGILFDPSIVPIFLDLVASIEA